MKWIAFFIAFSVSAHAAESKTILIDALLARVGREPVLYSDLLRFKDIEPIVTCGAGKDYVKPKDAEPLLQIMSRFIEDELIYQEIRTKKSFANRPLRVVIDTIMSIPSCRTKWQELGARYAKLWSTPLRPREGEALLVKELEKRLAIHDGESSVIQGDREVWLRGARVRLPIKLFLE